MLSSVLSIVAALLILCVIVVIHELGHFVVGRLCGIGVVEFSVGMGPKIFGFERKGIQYSLRALPLGGYCKFVGEDADDPDPSAMNNQPVWKRILTVAAGALMNFVLAYIAAVILFGAYSWKVVPRIDSVDPAYPAYEAGIQAGDVITSVNGTEIAFSEGGVSAVQSVVSQAAGGALEMTLNRDGEEVALTLTPELTTLEDGSERYMIGIVFGADRFTWAEAFPEAGKYMREASTMLVKALWRLVSRGEGAEDMSGTVGIIATVSETIHEGWYMVFYYLFVISLNLGIINLLPLPALDGGRLVFLVVEAIRGKPVPPEKEGLVHAIGLILFLALFVFLTYRDIVKLIH